MRVLIVMILASVTALGAGAKLFGSEANARTVSVTVTVRSASNEPIPNVIVGINVPTMGVHAAVTDAQGVAQIAADVPIGSCTVYASLGERTDTFDVVDVVLSAAAYASAVSSSHFKSHYAVAVGAEDTVVPFMIQGTECVSVTLHAAAGLPRQRLAVACFPGAPLADTQQPSSDLVVGGIAKGMPAMLVVCKPLRSNVHVIELTASETMENREIADVAVPTGSGTHEVSIRLADRSQVIKRPFVMSHQVTVMKSDLNACHVFHAKSKDGGLLVNINTSLPKLDAGRYAVVPGVLGSDPGPGAVYGHIKATGQIPAGIPFIDVVAGGDNQFQIDGVPARDASLGLPAYP